MASSLGDWAALGKLVEEHRARLLAMLERRLPPALAGRVDAEDILNEALVVAQRRYPEFRLQTSISPYTWLYRIALDALLETWRKETRACRDPAHELPWPDRSSAALAAGLVDTGTSPSGVAERHELQTRMRQALDQLPPRDREILWMRHDDGLTFGEAGAVLGISESAATLRYVRALKRLKERWRSANADSRTVP